MASLPLKMTPLPNHMFFESLFHSRRPIDGSFDSPRDPWVCVQFSATWCGPCQRLDKALIVEKTPTLKWYYCDVDENDTSLGYAGLKSIPGFCLIKDGMLKATKAGARDVHDVMSWLHDQGVAVLPPS